MKENSTKNIWTVGNVDEEKVERLSRELCLKPFTAKILVAKGYDTPESAGAYLSGGIEELADPYLLKDMDKAVERIRKAIADKEKILIYGDYDVDGITSVAALQRYLSFKGAEIVTYIPERINEGYGLNVNAIERFADENIKLIITVDSGITAHDEVLFARTKGIDVVITDHHECREELPCAVAVVNPHRRDSEYPFRELAGVGVVFRLICAMENGRGLSKICSKYSDIIALGTVADVMPIIGENRVIVKQGLACLANTKNKGLNALIDQTFSERKSDCRKHLTASSIGFGLAPRINAAGRVGDVNKALKLLTTEDKFEAEEIAQYLCAVNRQRQYIENNIFEQATEQLDSTTDFDNDKVIVLSSESWHIGVIGIVASKITEKYNLPCILISADENIGKGSGRSVKGFNINEAISACKDLLIKYGGHELAAGLTINKENIPQFRKAINEYAERNFDFDKVYNNIDADFEIDVSDITVDHAKEISVLEPFGLRNPLPLFCIKNAKIADIFSIGEGKHLKLIIEKNSFVATALYFGMPKERFPFSKGDFADFMCNIDMNDFRGTLSVQVVVKDVRMTEAEIAEKAAQEKEFSKILEGDLKTEARHLPQMLQMRSAFLYLKGISAGYGKSTELDIWKSAKRVLSEYNVSCTGVMFNIMLNVFEEMKLIKLERTSPDAAIFSLNKTEGKVNIENSEFLNSLKNNSLKE